MRFSEPSSRPIDTALFHFTHDILHSPRAVADIFKTLRLGARIAMAGTTLASWRLPFVNLWVVNERRVFHAD